jgi:hypothetical protein
MTSGYIPEGGVYRESPAAFMARLRRFNGEDAGEQTLSTLRILNRERR